MGIRLAERLPADVVGLLPQPRRFVLVSFVYRYALLLLIGLSACRPEAPPPPRPAIAFYHWRTALALNADERRWLDTLAVDRLYVKVFDIDWSAEHQQPIPLAALEWDTARRPAALTIVPVVFITNRSLQHLTGDPGDLAARLLAKVTERLAGTPFDELQIDCDWTAGTRTVYFELLRALRRQLPAGTTLSATIRLHQLRYPEQTGVPPIDRGLLMYYNMGDVDEWAESNSILNLHKAAAYLRGDAYPLPLDLALPLFRWGVVFRQRKLLKLINNLEAADLADRRRFATTGPGRYRVLESTYLGGYYLYRDDEIRLEAIAAAALYAAAAQWRDYAGSPPARIIFYHLDSVVLKSFNYATLRTTADLLVSPGNGAP